MIAYSIIAGQLADSIDRCIISTDSQEIADIAKLFGADVPFLRPAKYASDTSKDIEFFQHAIDWFRENESFISSETLALKMPKERSLDIDDNFDLTIAQALAEQGFNFDEI